MWRSARGQGRAHNESTDMGASHPTLGMSSKPAIHIRLVTLQAVSATEKAAYELKCEGAMLRGASYE